MEQPTNLVAAQPALEEVPADQFVEYKEPLPTPDSSTLIRDEEIEKISRETGADKKMLRTFTDLKLGTRELGYDEQDSTNALTSPSFWKSMGLNLAGTGNEMLLGYPTALWRKFFNDKKHQEALDRISALVDERKATLQKGLELGLGLPGFGAVAKAEGLVSKVAKGAAVGAAIGGTHGYLGSKEGEEIEDTARGLALGGVLGAAIPAGIESAGYLWRRKGQIFGYGLPKEGGHIEEKAVKMYEEAGSAEKELSSAMSEILAEPSLLHEMDRLAILVNRYPEIDMLISEGASKEYRREVRRYLPAEMRDALPQRRGREGELAKESQAELARKPKASIPPRDIDEFDTFMQGSMKESAETMEKLLIRQQFVRDEMRKLANRETGRDTLAKDYSSKAAARKTDKELEKFFTENKEANIGERRLTEGIYHHRLSEYRGMAAEGLTVESTSKLGKIADRLINPIYVMANIDRKLNTKGEAYLHDVTNGLDKFNNIAVGLKAELDVLRREAGSEENLVKIRNALDRGVSTGDQALDLTRDKYREFFSKVRREAVDVYNAAIPERENYVPYRLLPPVEIIKIIKRMDADTGLADRMDGLGRKQIQALRQGGEGLSGQAAKDSEFLRSLEHLTGDYVSTGTHVRDAVKKIAENDIDMVRRNNMVSTAEKAREGKVPEILLNKNVDELARSWIANTYRSAILYRPIRNMKNLIPLLRQKGEDSAADRLVKLTDALSTGVDAWGVRARGVADEFRARIDDKLANTEDPLETWALQKVRIIPDVLSALKAQVYPSLMGGRVKPVLRNALQPFGTTAMELATNLGGYGYGTGTVLKSYGKVLSLFRSGGIEKLLADKGYLAKMPFKNLTDDVENTLGAKTSRVVHTMDWMNQVLMSGMNVTENINRAVTYFSAEKVAKDYLAGNSRARMFAEKTLGAGWQVKLKELGPNPTVQAVTDIFAGHLIDRTQLRYGRVLEAEISREVGPVLAAFTKWPTSVLGDIVDKFRRGQGVGGTAVRWMIPFFALEALDRASDFSYDTLGEREKKFLYRGGISEYAPVTSLNSILTGQIVQSPITGLLFDMAKQLEQSGTVEEGAMRAFTTLINTGLSTFSPGAGLVNMIGKEFPAIFLDEKGLSGKLRYNKETGFTLEDK